ncbi:MAG: polar amino acid ABC transporter permease [Clostridiales bacterium]|nr:MAG: polar amino acid ABC transporter permease [Clostridiales bacterium]
MTFWQITLELLHGFGLTCLLFVLTLVFAMPLGLGLSFCTMSRFKPLRAVSRVFVWIIRGIPLMLFICMIYYLPGLLGSGSGNIFDSLDRYFTRLMGSGQLLYYGSFIAVLIAFVINYACYFSEIFRGGVESISHGQYEAGQVLGMTKGQIFRKVIFKQVVKRILPPMSNEVITLVKDTALANVIAIPEIIKQAKDMAATQALVWPLFYTAVFYLIFVGALTLLFGYAEKRLSYFKV